MTRQQELLALALVYGGAVETRVGELVPQEMWDRLHERGYTRLTSFGVPGADLDVDLTDEGRERLYVLACEVV